MATINKLPSGKFRAQVRLDGHYKSKTFNNKTQAKEWSTEIERQVKEMVTSGYIDPKALTLAYVIDQYLLEVNPRGRTKLAVLNQLKLRLGAHHPNKLNSHLQAFIDKRLKTVGGATISGDLSFLATVLDWGREVKKWNISGTIAREARAGLKHRKISTRSKQRERLPTQNELNALYHHFDTYPIYV